MESEGFSVIIKGKGYGDRGNIIDTLDSCPKLRHCNEKEGNELHQRSVTGLVGIQRVLEAKEERQDIRSQQLILANEQFASGYMGALGSIVESLQALVEQPPLLLMPLLPLVAAPSISFTDNL